ncbi:MAG: tail fiber domain-containing protein [Limisphaerales bacterium]
MDSKYWYIYIDTFNGGDNLIFKNSINQYMGITWGNGAVFSSSDAHLKTDIAPMEPVLNRVLQLQPVSYRFHQQPCRLTENARTFGAGSGTAFFQKRCNITKECWGCLTPSWSPVTVKAIQDLNAKFDDRSHASDDPHPKGWKRRTPC